MTMDEFNNSMQATGCKYSANVLLGLDYALSFVPRIKSYTKRMANCENSEALNKFKAEKRVLQDSMNKAMITVLMDALSEKRDGLIFESCFENMNLSQVQFINPVIKKWQPILKKYGVELKTY